MSADAKAQGPVATRGRTLARRRAVQALYQWQLGGQTPTEIEQQFLAEQDMADTDVAYFRELLQGIGAHAGELDEALRGCLDREIEAIDPVERAILWVGAFELRHRLEVPYRVAVNEAVELAKRFGAEDGYKYVNGVLDKLARAVRAFERPAHP